jgi:hypothetical protein
MLISLLVLLIVGCVVYWACNAILSAFGVGDPIATVVRVLLVVFLLVALLGQMGYAPALLR